MKGQKVGLFVGVKLSPSMKLPSYHEAKMSFSTEVVSNSGALFTAKA